MNYMKQVTKMLGVELGECYHTEAINRILSGTYKIVKIPILDAKEKEYLSNIIKPWRNCIYCIFKYGSEDYEYIVIKYDNKLIGEDQYILLPAFEKGKMYKGMKFGKEYTLEELGL